MSPPSLGYECWWWLRRSLPGPVHFICYGAGGDSQHQRQVVFAVAGGEFQGYGAAAALAAAGARAIVSL